MATDPLLGTEIDRRYLLESQLGKGGMGVVYRARDLGLDRVVALKLLPPQAGEDPKARQRFQREIKHAVAIEHPHIVPVYEAGYDGSNFYLAMRCVDGPDLRTVIEGSGPIAEPRAMRLLGQMAS